MKQRDSRFVRIALACFFLLVLCYALYEARGMLQGPSIQIPASIIFSETEFVTIQGQAQRISELRLNGERISVTEEGMFQEPYVLARGVNRLVLEAHDARGNQANEIVEIVFTGKTTTPTPRTTHGSSTPEES